MLFQNLWNNAAQVEKPNQKEVNKILKDVQSGDMQFLQQIRQSYPKFHWSGICYEKTGDTILHCAARLGYVNIIEYLLLSFNPKTVDCKNKDDKTALHEAAQFSQYYACEILLRYGANVNALKRADWTPIMLACTKVTGENTFKIIDLFVKYGSLINYPNKDGWTCLHLMSREGDVAIMNLLINHDLNPTVKTKNGRTALHIAALHGHLDILNMLLVLGLNVNDKDNCGNTALHEAVLGGNIDVCKVLVDHKADISIKNNCDYGLLHLAASEGNINTIKFILGVLKSDINEQTIDGLTALHCAARTGQKGAYQFLVENGASESIKDKFQRIPKDYFKSEKTSWVC